MIRWNVSRLVQHRLVQHTGTTTINHLNIQHNIQSRISWYEYMSLIGYELNGL